MTQFYNVGDLAVGDRDSVLPVLLKHDCIIICNYWNCCYL